MKRLLALLLAVGLLAMVTGPVVAVDDDYDDDGIPNDQDHCPVTPEDYDGDTDWDGCPESDGGGICVRLPCE